MTTLSEQLAAVDLKLSNTLYQLQDQWDGFSESQIKEFEVFQAKQQKDAEELDANLIKANEKAREDAAAERDKIIADFDKLQAELLAKEKAEADKAMAGLGEKHRYYGLTAKQITKDSKSVVIEEAKSLGVETNKANGKEDTELNIAKRIVAKLGE